MTFSRRTTLLLFACAGLGACAGGPYGRVREIRSQSIPGSRFHTVVVIAGEDDQSDLQITARVRERLEQSGMTVVRRSGLWETEEQALAEICPVGGTPTGIDGVLFVWWNRLNLRDCETHRPAYQIRGGYVGVDEMTRRLLRYFQERR